ncbi:hypothetical protein [Endozoicomonas arenosclerae]|uniref:hypothetical protein n=1 Tax=Endozoicomonas arenosclerae TaxID=1633495 RepID=UPI0007812992|nr:hypothetical protein [Endozoicomonas arenosclerae]
MPMRAFEVGKVLYKDVGDCTRADFKNCVIQPAADQPVLGIPAGLSNQELEALVKKRSGSH